MTARQRELARIRAVLGGLRRPQSNTKHNWKVIILDHGGEEY